MTMPKRKLRLIAKICLTLAFLCLLIDILTATTIYLLNPAFFYVAETNIPFRNFLVYQTPEATITFIGHFLLTHVLFLTSAATLLYITLWQNSQTPLTKLNIFALTVAIFALFYTGCLSLYGVSGNVQSIIYLLRG